MQMKMGMRGARRRGEQEVGRGLFRSGGRTGYQGAMHDLLVLSDLHIGRGLNPETGRHHHLETFFYDDDLRAFFRQAMREAKERHRLLRVVFNGDTFDFLRTEPDPCAGSWREQRFGQDLDARRAAELFEHHVQGHPRFIFALADLLEDGHDVVILPGNHDIEIQWKPVQEVLRRAVVRELEARLGPARAATSLERLVFKPWFHYEKDRIWIEHGCQYDSACAFRYPLRGKLTDGVDPTLFELDQPLGNFFQRYLYNAFGAITFIVPSTRANTRYLRFLLVNEPRLLFRVVASHLPFAVQVLRRLARKGDGARKPLKDAHRAELEELIRDSELGETLRRVDALKAARGDLAQAIRDYSVQTVKFLGLSLSAAILGAATWFMGFQAIQSVDGLGFKALLFLTLNFFLMGGAVAGIIYTLLRQPPESPTPLRNGAKSVARVVDTPIVTFGHTHDEVVWRYDRPGGHGWYFNTGTWIAVFTHDVLLPRERVQYTFLRVRDEKAELLHWSPGRNEAMPVILLDDGEGGERAIVAAPVPHAGAS